MGRGVSAPLAQTSKPRIGLPETDHGLEVLLSPVFGFIALTVALGTGFVGGSIYARPSGSPPELRPDGDKGGFIVTGPAGAYEALTMAGDFCKRWPADPRDPSGRARKYPVITETALEGLGGMRFDCIPHRELTGSLAQ